MLGSLLAPNLPEKPVLGFFTQLRFSEDLALGAQALVLGLFVCTLILLLIETRREPAGRASILLSGGIGALLLTAAVLRPARLTEQGQRVPGLSLILEDASHRLELPSAPESPTRRLVAERAKAELVQQFHQARVVARRFSRSLLPDSAEPDGPHIESDLLATLRQIAAGEGDRPNSIVVLSDGRLTRPSSVDGGAFRKEVSAASGGIPVHTVALASAPLNDRSIRSVGFTGSAIAHQPLSLKLEIGCVPVESCNEVEVVVRELLQGQEPQELARGTTKGDNGKAFLDLEVTLDRAGGRVIEVELLGDGDDDVPENDRRFFPVRVRRDRLRMLHVAGRPTYDVRALRMFLKSDQSIDLVSFFILRTPSDQVNARSEELALIPFPVDELFSEHLKSFDAVILQDIDAPRYQLDRHFHAIKKYVLDGGGIILVGGPTGFSSGGYAGSPVADVLPVTLPQTGTLISRKPFVPSYTEVGRAAPVLSNLRRAMGESLPEMSGTNILGPAREGALVLWEHPELTDVGATDPGPMPVLSLFEVGDGRSIAISLDSTHQLRFGEIGAKIGGRGYSDLWEGLLGWLMRDPRFEGAQLKSEDECISGRDHVLRVETLGGDADNLSVTLERLGTSTSDARQLSEIGPAADGARRFVARGLVSGGYAARVKVGEAPPSRTVFVCETGGEAWADSRPDEERLKAIAQATSGIAVTAATIAKLSEPPSTFIAARQKSTPLLPPWVWATSATLFLSLHWWLRRTTGHV